MMETHTGPTQVSVNLYLRSISKIDDYEMVSLRDAAALLHILKYNGPGV